MKTSTTEKNKIRSEGGRALLFYIAWLGNASLLGWFLSKDLKWEGELEESFLDSRISR